MLPMMRVARRRKIKTYQAQSGYSWQFPTTTYSSSAVVSGVSVQSTAYSLPNDAIYVATTGNDTTGNGSISTPYKTIAKGVAMVAAGGTVVLRGGTYREGGGTSASSSTPGIALNKALTIMPYPGEFAWVNGSVIKTGWTAGTQGATSIWSTSHSSYFKYTGPAGYVSSADPQPGNQTTNIYGNGVWRNGTLLKEVATLAELDTATPCFYINNSTTTLYVNQNPTSATVEATQYQQAFFISAANVAIRGIGIVQFASKNQNGAIRVEASNTIIDTCTIAHCRGGGISINGGSNAADDCTFINTTVAHTGGLAFHGTRANRIIVDSCSFGYGNKERFSALNESGGFKVTRCWDMIVKHSRSHDNYGDGFWCDISCYNARWIYNLAYNCEKGKGFDYEESAKGIIACNIAYNCLYGFYINEAGLVEGVDFYNNASFNCDSDYRIVEASGGIDRTNNSTNDPVTYTSILYDTGNVRMFNNIASGTITTYTTSPRLMYIGDGRGTGSKQDAMNMIAQLDYGAYHRPSAIPNNFFLATKNSADVLNSSLSALHTNFPPFEANAILDDSATCPWFYDVSHSDPTQNDYRITGTCVGTGARLPAHVAALLGLGNTIILNPDRGPLQFGNYVYVAPPVTPFATDAFGRTTSNGWGTADQGGAWTIFGTASIFSTDGSSAKATLSSGSARAVLATTSQRDTDIYATISTTNMSTGASVFIGLIMRSDGASSANEYRIGCRLNADGTVAVRAHRVAAGTETQIGSDTTVAGLTYAANTPIRIRAQAQGASPTTIRIKAWLAGQAEPNTWTFSNSADSTGPQTAGCVGVRGTLGSGANANVIVFDDLLAQPTS